MLRKPAWSPYIVGIIIGLLQIPAFILFHTGIATSSSYVKISTYVISLFGLSPENHSYFKQFVTEPKYLWQLFFVIGIIIGALVSSAAGGMRRNMPSSVWQQDFCLNDSTRYIAAFVGGFILIFGARLAGGGSFGHGLTGVGQLSLSSLISTVGMFAGGIIFVFLWRYYVNRNYLGDEI